MSKLNKIKRKDKNMTNYNKELEKLIKDKKNQFFDDINNTTGQGSFIGHCIILGYEFGLKKENQEIIRLLKSVQVNIRKLKNL